MVKTRLLWLLENLGSFRRRAVSAKYCQSCGKLLYSGGCPECLTKYEPRQLVPVIRSGCLAVWSEANQDAVNRFMKKCARLGLISFDEHYDNITEGNSDYYTGALEAWSEGKLECLTKRTPYESHTRIGNSSNTNSNSCSAR